MCANKKSRKMCKSDDKNEGWAGALRDAEAQLRKVKTELSGWERTVEHCRENLLKRRPWPGRQHAESATQN
jgi:hypothetical protein